MVAPELDATVTLVSCGNPSNQTIPLMIQFKGRSLKPIWGIRILDRPARSLVTMPTVISLPQNIT